MKVEQQTNTKKITMKSYAHFTTEERESLYLLLKCQLAHSTYFGLIKLKNAVNMHILVNQKCHFGILKILIQEI